MRMIEIAIIGGGAAGLVAAIAAAQSSRDFMTGGRRFSHNNDDFMTGGRRSCHKNEGSEGVRVRVFEMDERTGRRILATGNGRCNFSNANMRADVYRNADFVARVYGAMPSSEVLDFFADLGLLWTEEPDGRLLPRTGKASTVLDVLRARCAALGVEECCGAAVRELVPPAASGGVWTLALLDGRFERADAVVVAAGGQDGLSLVPEDVPATPFSPVLGPLKTDARFVRGLDGVRVKCEAKLLRDGAPVAVEAGELLFRKYGVSGICVFNLSRFARVGDTLSVDLFPEAQDGEVLALLLQRAEKLFANDEKAQIKDLFCGMILPNVAQALCSAADVSPAAALGECMLDDFERLAEACTGFKLSVEGIAEPGQCQVHRGGVSVEAVDAQLMAARHPGLFFAGEILDVDGPCGGYNLHWAWTSGLVAGEAAARFAKEAGTR